MSFRDLHRAGDPLVLPNAWDYASAAALVAAGFGVIGTTSLGVAAAHGLPDAAGAAGAATVALARLLGGLPCLFTVDIEAGPVELAIDVAAAGAVGVNLEDGRPDGTLAPLDRQCQLISTIKARVPELFVNARVDTHWLAAGGLDETLRRAEAYAVAGADGIFVPGLADAADISAVVGALEVPVNVLFLPGRLTVRQLADLGVRRISCGSLLFRAALRATVSTALAVARGGPVAAGIPGYAEVQRLVTAPPTPGPSGWPRRSGSTR